MAYLSAVTPILSAPDISALSLAEASALLLAEASATGEVARLEAILQELRTVRQVLGALSADMARAIQAVAKATPPIPDETLDETIAALEQVEMSRAPQHDRLVQVGERLLSRASTAHAPLRELLADIARTAVNMHADRLEALRDARWELMAILAERAPSPAADRPEEDLDTYLAKLLGA
jgi:hypothetical protein